MPEKILLETANLRSTLFAVVEQNNETAYFYIYPAEELAERYPVRACWLRNLVPAPASVDVHAMENGEAPVLPAAFCKHPAGKEPLLDSRLSVVWFPEDDGAALLYNDNLLAVIPGWSLYLERPVSYAADCIAVWNETLFPLGEADNNILFAKTAAASTFWQQWNTAQQAASPWNSIQEYFLSCYEKLFGRHQQYYAIDGGYWPPMAFARFDHNNTAILLTLGLSIRPMPWVDYLYEEPAGFRRIELGLAVDKSQYTEEQIMQMAQGIAGIADMPWRKISWLGEGHTISSGGVPAPFESFILSASLYNGPSMPQLEMYQEKVNLLWAVPVYREERDFAHAKPNGGYELLEQLINDDVNWIVRKRRSLVS